MALHGGRVDRRVAAGMLWSEGDDLRAAGNLRSALWRLRGSGFDLLQSTSSTVRLRADTVVDLAVRSARTAESLEVATVPVHAAPLHGSAQRVLLEAHRAAGDVERAGQAYDVFREHLVRRLGVAPSARLGALLDGLVRAPLPLQRRPAGGGARPTRRPAERARRVPAKPGVRRGRGHLRPGQQLLFQSGSDQLRTTARDGAYEIELPVGTCDVRTEAGKACSLDVAVQGATRQRVDLVYPADCRFG